MTEKELDTTYNILHLLDTEITSCPLITGKVNIIAYQINREGFLPFLQFFLLKNKREKVEVEEGEVDEGEVGDLVSFPKFDATKFMGSELLETCSTILDILFLSYGKIESLYKYTGKMEYNSETYIFFDCSEYNIQVHALKNDIWLTLPDEIINYKSIYKYAIDPLVSQFFLNNLEFLYLTSKEMNYYESPIVAYIGCIHKKVDFISIFGQLPDPTKNGYYCFTSYENIVKPNSSYIRFALFTGNMNLDLELDFGDSFYINGEWILKDYNRQITLSSHY